MGTMDMSAELCRIKVSELQRRLAQKATDDADHRFTNLYSLMTWEPMLIWAFETLMSNKGSRTAGIDGMDKQTAINNREAILLQLKADLKAQSYQHQSVRRVYIPKSNGRRRPLGIPTLRDRVVQTMVKAILEPIFESDFLDSSHGFRPQRSCHTAIGHLHVRTAPRQVKMYWVIEGDITGCFDHIQHKILMRLLRRRIQDKKLLGVIWQMLKAGVMEGTLFKKTQEGTPQGGVVSPLLANIYLHELDVWMDRQYTGLNSNEKSRRRRRKEGNAFYVRYADDFVVAWNGPKEGAQQLKAELAEFLKTDLGLELSAEKTHVTHVTEGYDFLGFTIKRVIDPKKGYNELLVYPSKKNLMKVKARLKSMTKRGTTLDSVKDKITAMNYLLRGWANYYQHCAASQTLDYVGSYGFTRMERWLRKKTGQRVRAVYRRYYRRSQNGYLTWYAEGTSLFHPGVETKINYRRYGHRPNPYLKANGEIGLPFHANPFPRQAWNGMHPRGEKWTVTREEVLRRDNYQCVICGQGERLEVHHIRKHKAGAAHNPEKLVTLCLPCHRQTKAPRSEVIRLLARYHLETGEPDAAKVASPVREGA